MSRDRGTPSMTINWLFFDHVNTYSDIHSLQVAGHDLKKILQHHRNSWANEIEKEFRFRADPVSIRFWTPLENLDVASLPEDWITTTELTNVAKRKRLTGHLQGALGGGGDEECLHLIITAEKWQDDEAAERDQENAGIVSELPLHGLYHRYNTLIKRVKSFPLHESAKSTEYLRLQNSCDFTAIYDGFCAPISRSDEPAHVTIAPPIETFHPVFSQFLDNINDPTFEPDEAAIPSVAEFITAAATQTDEGNRANVLRRHLIDIFCQFMGKFTLNNGRTPDGMIFKQLHDCVVPLIVMEIKHSITQASYSVLNLWTDSELSNIRDKCCCPTFILAGGGPYLSVLGVVLTDRFIVQRLTDVMCIGEATIHEEAHLYCLSRIFTSLRHCLRTLNSFYDGILKRTDLELIPNQPHPRYFPYPTSFTEYDSETRTEFKYLDVLESDSTNVTFLAQTTSDDPQKLIVKFVDRYGVNAHVCLAANGMAPKLLFCGLLNGVDDARSVESACGATKSGGLYLGPLRMVVMEYIDGISAQEVPLDVWPADAYSQVKAAVTQLHCEGLVFGDLRRPNIMFTRDSKVMLIDFDWAGKEGEVRYPRGLSSRVVWPDGAGDFRLIKKEHDMVMLERNFT